MKPLTPASAFTRLRTLRVCLAAIMIAGMSTGSATGALLAKRASLGAALPLTHDSGRVFDIHAGHALVEGDMLLGPLDESGRLASSVERRAHRSTLPDHRWPEGRLVYTLNENLGAVVRQRILSALDHWNQRTGLAVVQRDSSNAADYPDYLRFEASDICASYVGRIGGEQPVWISPQCSIGSIMHEIGHALGFYHEHTRPDRDNYISVQWDNISSRALLNFAIMDSDASPVGPYDYDSIMHYGAFYFSSNGLPTIVVPDGVSIGQRNALSERDVAAFDALYATDLALQLTEDRRDGGVDVVAWVQNIGDQNAADVVLDLVFETSGTWQPTDAETPWQCDAQGHGFQCRLSLLKAGRSARIDFSASSAPPSENPPRYHAGVSARTADTDLSNNLAGRLPGTGRPDTERSAPLLTAEAAPPGGGSRVSTASDSFDEHDSRPSSAATPTRPVHDGAAGGTGPGWLLAFAVLLLLRAHRAGSGGEDYLH